MSQFVLPFLLLVVASSPALLGEERDAEAPSVFLIGNSLTWDTVPSRLDGDVQWHVDCGKSLPFICTNPDEPCVKTSTLWPKALRAKPYDILSVQPHYGSTITEDVAVVSQWLGMQPKAVCVIHTGWGHHAKRAEEYADDDPDGTLTHSRAYFDALLAELRKRHPEREFRTTNAFELLARVDRDAKAGKAPIDSVEALHRDAIHVTHGGGRYLMHNAMRRTLGQPPSAVGFEKVDEELRTYLDGVLADVLGKPAKSDD